MSLVSFAALAAPSAHHIVNVKVGKDDRCEAAVDEGSFVEIDQLSNELKARFARDGRRGTVTLNSGVDIPWRCVGIALSALSRSGYAGKIGFISEPPPVPR